MSGKYVDVDVEEFKQFLESVEKAARGEFKKGLELFLEGIGYEFLRIVQDEIVRRGILDARLLLASFEKGAEVGSNVEYAKFVNDGHWTNPKGVERRFVPGYWVGDRFVYEPGAKTGMVLKQHWVNGKPYFDSALRILNQLFPEMLESKMQAWIDTYFGG